MLGLVTHAFAQFGNRLLRLDPDTGSRLAPLDGKTIAIEVTEPRFSLYLTVRDGGIDIARSCDASPHATVRGSLDAFLRLARAARTPDPATMQDILMEGDIEAARRLLAVFTRLDIDWEEHASHVVGDVAAHGSGNIVRGLSAWADSAAHRLLRDAGEYLQHESQLLPSRAAMDGFLSGVDTLRDDVERLAQRVQQLRGANA